jgi:hypothetical protein
MAKWAAKLLTGSGLYMPLSYRRLARDLFTEDSPFRIGDAAVAYLLLLLPKVRSIELYHFSRPQEDSLTGQCHVLDILDQAAQVDALQISGVHPQQQDFHGFRHLKDLVLGFTDKAPFSIENGDFLKLPSVRKLHIGLPRLHGGPSWRESDGSLAWGCPPRSSLIEDLVIWGLGASTPRDDLMIFLRSFAKLKYLEVQFLGRHRRGLRPITRLTRRGSDSVKDWRCCIEPSTW